METTLRNLPTSRRRRSYATRGVSVIELGVSMLVLTTGSLGLLLLALAAVTAGTRNRLDTGATGVAHTVLEQIIAKSTRSNAGSTFTIQDCRSDDAGGPQSWTVETSSAAAPGAGASLNPSSGAVDFTQSYGSVPFNYKMRFVSCGSAGRESTYEVRWNIQDVSSITRLVTVSVRPLAASSGSAVYALPVTLRSFASY